MTYNNTPEETNFSQFGDVYRVVREKEGTITVEQWPHLSNVVRRATIQDGVAQGDLDVLQNVRPLAKQHEEDLPLGALDQILIAYDKLPHNTQH